MAGLDTYFLSILTNIGIFSIWALGQNFILGYAGLPNLGPAAFAGVGAYISALLAVNLNLPFLLALPLSALIGALIGAAIGWVCLRVAQDYLAIVTMGMNFIFIAILMYTSLGGHLIFGGSQGISLPPLVILGHSFAGFPEIMILVWTITALVALIDWRLSNSRLGFSLKLARDDEVAAQSIGIDISRTKVVAFAVGSLFLTLGGIVYAHFISWVKPGYFDFGASIEIILMPLMGGLGTTLGPITGAVMLVGIPEVFRLAPRERMMSFAILLIAFTVFQPTGLFGHNSYLRRKVIEPLRIFLQKGIGAKLKKAKDQFKF